MKKICSKRKKKQSLNTDIDKIIHKIPFLASASTYVTPNGEEKIQSAGRTSSHHFKIGAKEINKY